MGLLTQDNQPISFWAVNGVSDGAGGTTGEQTQVYGCSAEVHTPKGSRNTEGGRTALQQEVNASFWVNSAYTPRTGDTLRWLGERFTLKQVNYVDSRRLRWYVVGVQQTGL